MTPRLTRYSAAAGPILALGLFAAPTVAPRSQTAREDSVRTWFPTTVVTTTEPIIVHGRSITVREVVQRAMQGERKKLSGHADATYRVTAHIAMVWPERKVVQTQVYRVYGDSTGYQRRVLLAAREEHFNKKEGDWVFDKTDEGGYEDYRIDDDDISRFTRIPVYLERDEEFDFALMERTLEADRVVFHVRFKPKSDFSEMPRGDIWIDSRGFHVIHEIYEFTNNPMPMLIKGFRRISLQWMPLPGGEWVPKQLAGEVDFRRGPMGFVPSMISFKQIWEDFRFDLGYDERLFGEHAPAGVVASGVSRSAETDSAVAPDSAAAPALLATLQREDDAAYTPEVRIENQAFIDSTAERHDVLGVGGLNGGIPLYGSDWRWSFDPQFTHWDYNRVEGFVFGGEAEFHRADGRRGISGFGAYATASEEFRYRAELRSEIPGTDHRLDFVASFRDYVEPFGSSRITFNSVRAFVGGADEQDYLHRLGGKAGVVYEPWDEAAFDAGFEGVRERSVATGADFSFFGDMSQLNPAVDEGDEYAIVAGFSLEGGRWLNARVTQRLAGGALGGDFRYNRTDITLNARGFPVGRQEFELTLQGVASGDAPPFQQLADVGGLSTVRGYERRTHVGNHSFAARLEYLFPYDVFGSTGISLLESLGIQVIPWADAGRVGEGDSQDWITSVGVGLQRYLWPIDDAANLRLDFAWPLDDPEGDFKVYLWFVGMR
jgi:hypothetical protein